MPDLNATELFDAVKTHAMTSGLFDRVNGFEPKSRPGHGLTAAVWVDQIGPARGSGLAATCGRIVLNIRVYTNMVQEPQDAIDPEIITAVDRLMAAYSGQFELDIDNVRNVDLLGLAGIPMTAQAGYLNQDGQLYRVMTITLPIILNDIWAQVA